jgi:hypothetical protein
VKQVEVRRQQHGVCSECVVQSVSGSHCAVSMFPDGKRGPGMKRGPPTSDTSRTARAWPHSTGAISPSVGPTRCADSPYRAMPRVSWPPPPYVQCNVCKCAHAWSAAMHASSAPCHGSSGDMHGEDLQRPSAHSRASFLANVFSSFISSLGGFSWMYQLLTAQHHVSIHFHAAMQLHH